MKNIGKRRKYDWFDRSRFMFCAKTNG